VRPRLISKRDKRQLCSAPRVSTGRSRRQLSIVLWGCVVILTMLFATQLGAEGRALSRSTTLGSINASSFWHFPPLAGTPKHVSLVLFNPNRQRAHVWLRTSGPQGVHLWSVDVYAGSVRTVVLSRTIAADSVSVATRRKIVASRLGTAGGGSKYAFGEPGPGTFAKGTMPMPAQRWHFPPLRSGHDVVLLTVYNPSQQAVGMGVQFIGTRAHLYVHVPAGTSKEVSLSLTSGTNATKALLITCTGDVVPQRSTLSSAGTHSSGYGTSTF
jgi:hypothetical protein